VKIFTYDSLPGKVIFGPGTSRSRLAEEMGRMGVSRVLLIATELTFSLLRFITGPSAMNAMAHCVVVFYKPAIHPRSHGKGLPRHRCPEGLRWHLRQMRRHQDVELGLATMCIGVGQGIAIVVEKVA